MPHSHRQGTPGVSQASIVIVRVGFRVGFVRTYRPICM